MMALTEPIPDQPVARRTISHTLGYIRNRGIIANHILCHHPGKRRCLFSGEITRSILKHDKTPRGLDPIQTLPLNARMLRSLILTTSLASTPLLAQESIERLDPALDRIIPPDAKIETLCQGFDWAEGPVWDSAGNRLLFSDVPTNTVYQWKEGDSKASIYLKPSGFTGPSTYGREPGSNGLAIDGQGRLISCEHGDRRISALTPKGGKITLADRFDGKRFNSPNDLAIATDGSIFFTDPPYGLPGGDRDTEFREIPFHGVYRIDPDGKVSLFTKDLDRPNGVALSPDQKTLYVAQSHGPAPVLMAYPILPDGTAGEGKILFNTKDLKGPGLPDGLKVHSNGTIFCTGPGGCLILTPQGKLLGRILCHRPTANVAFGPSEKSIFLTSDDRILRINLATP